jgi:hypothetical protein
MKPNGLVFAASMTSHTSTPMAAQMTFSSLTSAILTARKMFSVSFTVSAVSAELTGTVFTTIWS